MSVRGPWSTRNPRCGGHPSLRPRAQLTYVFNLCSCACVFYGGSYVLLFLVVFATAKQEEVSGKTSTFGPRIGRKPSNQVQGTVIHDTMRGDWFLLELYFW